MGDALAHHLAGDLVEGDTLGLVVRQVQQMLQMPGDGLSLAVRVGGTIHGVAGGSVLFQLPDQLLLAADGFIFRFKIVLDVHAQGTFRQVT